MKEDIPVLMAIYPIGDGGVIVQKFSKFELAIKELRTYPYSWIYFYTIKEIMEV